MRYDHIVVPADGEVISINRDTSITVPRQPIIPYITGDGIGVDVTPVMQNVLDAAVEQAYGTERGIAWMEVFAGGRGVERYGEAQYLPDETMDALERFVVSIKGPLATPIGGGIRSLNVAIRQRMDLYACVRPI
ncbi:MAG TPA: isocitrate/isopropylmalate family dehydrogenase, partial [Gammaproteobacteria bacterium]|nr:isocitrate/isopropylmalate family dehydrogenase [Gammaproteobacteria bacterium]